MKKVFSLLFLLLFLFACSNREESKIKAYVTVENEKKEVANSKYDLWNNSKFWNFQKEEFLSWDSLTKIESSDNQGIVLKAKFKPKKGKKKDIEGIKVRLREGIPMEALFYTEKDYLEMIKKEAPIAVKEIDKKERVIYPVEDIAKVYEEINKEFPDFSKMEEKDMQILLRDFPDIDKVFSKLTSREEIIALYSLLADIYMAQQVYLVNRELIHNTPLMQEKLKVNFLESKFGLTEAERIAMLSFTNLNFKPLKALAIKESAEIAKLHSEAWAKELKIGTGDTKADALRHTLWMYELCRIITEQTAYFSFGFYRKTPGIKFAEEFGTAREAKTWERYEILKDNPLYSGNYRWLDLSNRMDLHNNYIGRSYFDETTSTQGLKIGMKEMGNVKLPVIFLPKLNAPTTEKVVEGLKEKINNGIFIDKTDKKASKEFYRLGTNKYGIEKYKGQIIYLQ